MALATRARMKRATDFGRPHKSLARPYPRTPAMAAGLADPDLDMRGRRRATRL